MTSNLPAYPPPLGGMYRLGGGGIAVSNPPMYVPKGLNFSLLCDLYSKETLIGVALGTAFLIPAFCVSSSSLSYGFCAAAGITYGLTFTAKLVKSQLCPTKENTPLLPQTR